MTVSLNGLIFKTGSKGADDSFGEKFGAFLGVVDVGLALVLGDFVERGVSVEIVDGDVQLLH